jgi:hypothetical protein
MAGSSLSTAPSHWSARMENCLWAWQNLPIGPREEMVGLGALNLTEERSVGSILLLI